MFKVLACSYEIQMQTGHCSKFSNMLKKYLLAEIFSDSFLDIA